MKQIQTSDIDLATKKVVEENIGYINLAYTHNDANVFIHFERSGVKDLEYKSFAKICVIKSDKMFVVGAHEEVGNEVGTVFSRVDVKGLPNNDDIFYPYGIFLANEKKPDTDIMGHIAEILKRFEDKDSKNPKLGKIFRSYVPMSYHEMYESFKNKEQQAKNQEKTFQDTEMLKKFMDNVIGF
jgi:hypothetical protein